MYYVLTRDEWDREESISFQILLCYSQALETFLQPLLALRFGCEFYWIP